MGRRRATLVAVTAALLLAAGCAKPGGPWREHADGPRVVATTTQVADMAAVLGSDDVIHRYRMVRDEPAGTLTLSEVFARPATFKLQLVRLEDALL